MQPSPNNIVDELAKALWQTRVRNDSIFLSTAVTYPNGVGVTVRIDLGKGGYTETDDGYAEVIAEDMGASGALHRIAAGVAERAGITYDRGAFAVHDVEKNTLHVAVTAIANASAKAMERVLVSLEQPRIKRSRDIFDKRLREAFGDAISFDVQVRGATSREWGFNAGLVKRGVFERLFELVSPSTQAVALANMKIADVRAIDDPPTITAALSDYDRTEPALRSILSSAGGMVINANDSADTYRLLN